MNLIIFTMLFLILAGLFLIIAGSISNKYGSQMGQPTMGCGILLIAFVIFIILIWP
ncbi:hypothetical protein ABEX53_19310 [Bacillus toyonensis]|uniref:hypothetical protein n=1 Tax=Bacillus toyonensis TaxID=155322 RepID=UPI0015E15FA2|nr:hypothetical protein [Bacillus toyonensis]MED3539865.1 hypothetical protein [Bacillus toyonensis]